MMFAQMRITVTSLGNFRNLLWQWYLLYIRTLDQIRCNACLSCFCFAPFRHSTRFLKDFSTNIYIVGTCVFFLEPSGATAVGATFAQQQMRFVLLSWVAVTADHHPFKGLCFLVVAVLSEVLGGSTKCSERWRAALKSTT